MSGKLEVQKDEQDAHYIIRRIKRNSSFSAGNMDFFRYLDERIDLSFQCLYISRSYLCISLCCLAIVFHV